MKTRAAALFVLLSLFMVGEAAAAVCTSLSAGRWDQAARWSCGHIPLAADTVVIAHNSVQMRGNYTVAGLTINAGAVLDDNGNNLTVSGSVVINGTYDGTGNNGNLIMTGNGQTLSGTGTVIDIGRIQIDANITIPAGSNLNLTLRSEIRVGDQNPATLTIDGTITGTAQTNGNRIIRADNNNTSNVVINGTVNAPNSFVEVQAGGTVTNNGTVSLQYLDGNNNATSAWAQGVNSNLTLTQPAVQWVGTFDASAVGNTVTFNGTATPFDPATYYNIAGAGVTCPHPVGITVLGTSPCGSTSVTANPTNCVNDASIGTQPWIGLTSVGAQDNIYALATASNSQITNYLKCTGYNFSIPTGAIITGITVGPWVNATRTFTVNAMQLVKGDVIQATNLAAGTAIPNGGGLMRLTPTQLLFGSATNLWGNTWSATDINNPAFGAAFAAQRGAFLTLQTVGVDAMPITVSYTLPVSVQAIDRADADPTTASSVSWTVTIGADVSGVSSSNFTLVNTGLGGAPAITSVTGGPAIWTVTATTGTGSGTLGLNMTNVTGISPAVTGVPFIGQVYSVRPLVPVSLVAEYRFDENSAGVVADSSVSGLNGTINGGITVGGSGKVCGSYNFNGTDAFVSVPDDALLNQSQVSVMAWARHTSATIKPWEAILAKGDDAFRLHLNGGCSINTPNTLEALSFGINTGCATADADSNTVPVANQWYHVAGTYDGTTIKIYVDGVLKASGAYSGAITSNTFPLYIGANSQQAGRNWSGDLDEVKIFAGALSALDIAIGSANENAGKSWDGTARTCPVYGPDHYELSLPTSGITCLPTAVTVTACADNTSPCTNPLTTISGKTATLSTTAGTLGSATVTFNASGVASTTLSYPAATDGATATVTLSGEQAAATNPRQCCPDGVSCVAANSCSTAFNTAGFVVSGSAGGSVATIANQVAGTSSGTYYLRAVKTLDNTSHTCGAALTGANIPVNFAYECVNPATCYAGNLMSVNGGASTVIAGNDSGSVTSYASVNMTFDASGNASFILNYGDVGQVKLWVNKTVNSALMTGSSNLFVVKPDHFELSAIQQTASPNLANPAAANAAGSIFVNAGEQFSVTVTAKSSSGATTPNYGKESPAESVTLTSTLTAGLGLTNNPALGGAFGTFTDGVATGTNFTWNEVGIITLTPSIADGDYLGAGDVSGTASGNVGRFYAAQFALSGGVIANRSGLAGCAAPAGCGTFTYMGEEMSAAFRLTAQAVDGTRLQNYVDAFAKFDPVAGPLNLDVIDNPLPPAVRTPLGARVSMAGLPAVTGQFLSTCVPAPACLGAVNVVAPFMISRGANADGPYAALDVGIAPQDSDGATLVYNLDTTNVVAGANNHALVGRTEVRYGRIRLSNAHGSELLPLPMTATVQFWNGTFWVTSATDSVTSLTLAATYSVLNKAGATIGTTAPTPTGAATVANGILGISLSKPTGGAGRAMVVPSVPVYLPLTGGLATFGVYRGNNEFIYLRENY